MTKLNHEKIDAVQYQLLANMRINQDTMVWQTPILSLTGQAFLFVIAFGDGLKMGA